MISMGLHVLTVIAEEFRQHLPDNAGNNVAVAVHFRQVAETFSARIALKFHHPLCHDPDTAFDSMTTCRRQTVCDPNDPFSIGNEVMFSRCR